MRPQDSPTRETKRLDGRWHFLADPGGAGRTERWFAGPLHVRDGVEEMPVPASYNDLTTRAELRDHIGEVWYQREVRIPRGWAGERILLRLESATHRATVWVAETELGSHEGGYLPFDVDLTDHAVAGELVRITVAVDNRLTWQSVPPGVVEETDAGPRQRYWHDFFNYAGLHRSVWLHSVPQTRIEDITVVPDLEGDTGVVYYAVEHTGAAGVSVQVLDAGGAVVAADDGATGTIRIVAVHPWEVGEGYQYTLRVSLTGSDGQVVDSYDQRFGVRTVAIEGGQILINGKPVYLTGFGMHEDHVARGKGYDDASWKLDFELLDWIGANSLRTSHYPYAEDVMDYADAHGILVIDEAPAVGFNMGLGGGIFGGQGYTTFSPDTVNEATRANHAQVLTELYQRDKNRPSVIVWSIANEPESDTDASYEYFAPLFEHMRALDPHRPVGYVNVMLSPYGKDKLRDLCDLYMLNRYYGWYVDSGDIENAMLHLRSELGQWAQDGKPILMTEYGADTLAGLRSLDGATWSEEYQRDLLEATHAVFDEIEEFAGEHIWNFADFQTTKGIMRVDGNKKGVFTRDRRPKAAAHRVRERWTRIRRGD